MKLIDIILLSLCVLGLIYFYFDRRKYTSISTYHKKLERLNELRKRITMIENKNKDEDEDENNTSVIYNNESSEQLKLLKTELKEVEKYIQNARMYNKKLRV